MLKFLHLTAVFSVASILCIAEAGLSHPLSVKSQASGVPNSDTNKLVCYMQTADGRTLNLDSLCRNKPNKATAQPQIVVSDVIHEEDYMTGRIVNTTGKTVYHARVNYEVLGENGTVIERGAVYTEPSSLNPGQAAMFETFMPKGRNVRTTSVTWDDKKSDDKNSDQLTRQQENQS
jgi:hypothetical protein